MLEAPTAILDQKVALKREPLAEDAGAGRQKGLGAPMMSRDRRHSPGRLPTPFTWEGRQLPSFQLLLFGVSPVEAAIPNPHRHSCRYYPPFTYEETEPQRGTAT